MKTIKNSKDITTLEVGDKVIFGDLEYTVVKGVFYGRYYLETCEKPFNDAIFKILSIDKKVFIKNLGIDAIITVQFPETKSLEALTAIVSALFKKYEKQIELPKTWEEFCKRNKMGDKRFCLYHGDIVGTGITQNTVRDTILIESPEEAQAFRALMQLRQLRKAYVKGWEPDWKNDNEPKYCINLQANSFDVQCWYHMSNPFSFPTARLAKQFLDNFQDLLEIAKPLL